MAAVTCPRVWGGGIWNDSGTVKITSNTIGDNKAGTGGGIANAGKMIITDSTIGHNTGEDKGGGICPAAMDQLASAH